MLGDDPADLVEQGLLAGCPNDGFVDLTKHRIEPLQPLAVVNVAQIDVKATRPREHEYFVPTTVEWRRCLVVLVATLLHCVQVVLMDACTDDLGEHFPDALAD